MPVPSDINSRIASDKHKVRQEALKLYQRTVRALYSPDYDDKSIEELREELLAGVPDAVAQELLAILSRL